MNSLFRSFTSFTNRIVQPQRTNLAISSTRNLMNSSSSCPSICPAPSEEDKGPSREGLYYNCSNNYNNHSNRWTSIHLQVCRSTKPFDQCWQQIIGTFQ
jgi:hypothetical protein